jgi:hypothetical protein
VRKVNLDTHETEVQSVDVPDNAPCDCEVAKRRRRALKLVMIALVAKRVTDDELRRQVVLEHRIAEVRRWFDGSRRDGREIEEAFRRVCKTMTPEEQELFFDDFIRSWGSVMTAANRRLKDAFVEAVGPGTRTTTRRGT